jgi:hypothetical protein
MPDLCYMPDLYLYVDGQPVGLDGQPASGPAQLGDFARFANPPQYLYPISDRCPWNACRTDPSAPGFLSQRDGNPWELQFDTEADESPDPVRCCDELGDNGDPHDG